MITIMVFARGATSTLKQSSSVTVKGITKTTTEGEVSFDLPAPGTYNVIVTSSGYKSFQGDLTFGQYANLVDVTLDPEPPDTPGDAGVCWAEKYDTQYGSRWTYTHPDLGRIGGDYSSRERAEGAARGDNRCKKRVPPPETEEEKITRNVVQRVQGQIETALGSAIGPIQSALNGVPSMINSMIADALAPVTASIDALKLWIEEQIIDILLRALDREVKEMK